MTFLRVVKGCTKRGHIPNEAIRQELGDTPILQQVQAYRRRWIKHLESMGEERVPKLAWKYTPREGRRDVGRPRKRWSCEPEQDISPPS